MIRPGTFDRSYVFSDDLAFQMNYFFQGKMGVMKGCAVTNDGVGNLSISEGFFAICGRILNNIGGTLIPIPVVASGTLYSILVYEVDLTQINTPTQFNQGALKIISDGSAYPTLTKQDLTDGGTLHQYEFCRFANTSAGAGVLTDTRVILDMSAYVLPEETGVEILEPTRSVEFEGGTCRFTRDKLSGLCVLNMDASTVSGNHIVSTQVTLIPIASIPLEFRPIINEVSGVGHAIGSMGLNGETVRIIVSRTNGILLSTSDYLNTNGAIFSITYPTI